MWSSGHGDWGCVRGRCRWLCWIEPDAPDGVTELHGGDSLARAAFHGVDDRRPDRTPSSPTLPSTGRIAFNAEWGPEQEPNTKNIWSIEPNGSGLVRVTEVANRIYAGPAWTPDGRHIVFTVERPDGAGRIHTMDASGNGLRPVGTGDNDFDASVSHDGRTIAFAHDDTVTYPVAPNEGRIFLMGVDGTDRRPLTNRITSGDWREDDFPTFSPDDRQVAFQRGNGIWVIGVDGTGLHRVLSGDAQAQRPRWSPDGRSLVFSIGGDGPDSHIAVLDLPTGAMTDLGPGGQPDWSPDGEWLAFWRWAPATRHLAIVVSRADGSQPTEILLLKESMLPVQPNWDWGLRAVSWGTAR